MGISYSKISDLKQKRRKSNPSQKLFVQIDYNENNGKLKVKMECKGSNDVMNELLATLPKFGAIIRRKEGKEEESPKEEEEDKNSSEQSCTFNYQYLQLKKTLDNLKEEEESPKEEEDRNDFIDHACYDKNQSKQIQTDKSEEEKDKNSFKQTLSDFAESSTPDDMNCFINDNKPLNFSQIGIIN